ncbi:MAG: hypothetical protein HZY75_05820 [Nocardioidaceae bacterium]|nr:MAG: hypothetical protein HZY75_05820 [Nocardioidaceae bacterium]
MSKSRKKARARLAAARDHQTPVTVTRRGLACDETSGFVIALSHDWVVLHTLDGAYLDAVTMLRLDLVTKVRTHSDEAYILRATEGLGVPLGSFECDPDAAVGELLDLASQRDEIIGAHLESRDGDWVNFGRIHHIGKNRLDLQFIGRDGDWVDFVEAWKLRDITRIEFGGRYIGALERFGDPRPEVVARRKH